MKLTPSKEGSMTTAQSKSRACAITQDWMESSPCVVLGLWLK